MFSAYDGLKYDCEVCDYKTSFKSTLYVHVQFVQYGGQYKRNIHVKFIHEGYKYNCELCDYKVTQKGKLRKHVQSIYE